MLKYKYKSIIKRGDFMEERKKNLFVSELLSRAFNICIDNFLEILKAVGIFMAPVIIIPLILIYTVFATALIGSSFMYSYPYSVLEERATGIGVGIVLLIMLIVLILGVLSLFGSLVIIKIIDDANRGYEVSWRSATRYVWEKKWEALGLNILVWLMMIAALIVFMILFMILAILTLAIGLIILIPLYIAVILLLTPALLLFNSTLLVNNIGIIDSIRETFLLFRKGYFWATIGRITAISGIFIGIMILLGIFDFIPFIGPILMVVGSYALSVYMSAYISIFVYDRNKPNMDDFGGNNNSENGFIDPII